MARRKRLFDLVVGSAAALLALPILVILATAVAVNLRTSPFFVQQRVGLGGRRFWLLKLRTLPRGTPEYADKYSLAEVPTTGFCRFLRSTHLDELPQLLHVPFGRMSLVGPRPEMPSLFDQFDPDFARERTTVRPGCTGLWQIGADAHRLISEAPQYDLAYVRGATLRMDAWILWRTVRQILPGVEAITLADLHAEHGAFRGLLQTPEPAGSQVTV